MKFCILHKFLVNTHNRFFYFIKLVDENENIYKKETWNMHESKQNMSEVLCYHMVWSVSLPQDPAEGVSKVTAVLLGSGGTLGGGALVGEGAHWESTPEGLLVFCPFSFLAFWLSGGEKSFSFKCFHYVCFTLSLKTTGTNDYELQSLKLEATGKSLLIWDDVLMGFVTMTMSG